MKHSTWHYNLSHNTNRLPPSVGPRTHIKHAHTGVEICRDINNKQNSRTMVHNDIRLFVEETGSFTANELNAGIYGLQIIDKVYPFCNDEKLCSIL